MQTEQVPVGQPLHLRVGEIVEVRSEAEILATLDARASWSRSRSCRRCCSSAASGSGWTSWP